MSKNWNNVDYGSYTITGSADTLFDFADAGSPSSRPARARAFMGTLETANIRMRDDGTSPTASEGQLVYKGSQLIFTEGDMENMEMIRTGSTSAVVKGHFVTAEAGDILARNWGDVVSGTAGDVAHDAADSGNPVKIGGKANTSLPSAVAASDRVDGMFDVYGRLVTVPYIAGASEVKMAHLGLGASSTRTTVATPTSGTAIRLISASMAFSSATATEHELYFDDGENIGTDEDKAIAHPLLDVTDAPNFVQTWPDGGGPIGAVDDVLSFKKAAAESATRVTVLYREE